ncbi:MAG TPA: hypothetical protein VIG64_00885 [Actinomycetota bacterium]|jgi:hypothetical protein
MHMLLTELSRRIQPSDERGAIGWLTIGIIIGVLLVVFGIIKFLIPGE